MYPISFAELEFSNSRNPELFVTGILTFNENERDEVYTALGHPNWRDKFWSEEDIENALLYPTIAKMNRILAVQDILTIERIRGVLTSLNNSGIRKPIESVTTLVNLRFREILSGKKKTEILAKLPSKEEDKEKEQLKKDKADLMEQLRKQQEEHERQFAQMQAQINQLLTEKLASKEVSSAVPEKKSPGRPPKKT